METCLLDTPAAPNRVKGGGGSLKEKNYNIRESVWEAPRLKSSVGVSALYISIGLK